MDNERKKNGLIRLLGRLGRRVKFLQKPLTVLVILGVSIHHLLKKFFFDVNYHTARMRVLTGSLCFALLFTLFVIPAIADEGDFDLTDVVTEEIQLPTEEPAPAPEPELTEEVPADQPSQNADEVAQAPSDIPAVPENTGITPDQGVPVDGEGGGYTPQDPVIPNTWTTDDSVYNDSSWLNNDGTVPQPGDQVTGADGETYEVDDDGNLIDGEGNIVDPMTRSLRQGPAVRLMQAPAPVITNIQAPRSVTVAPAKSECDYNEAVDVVATATSFYTRGAHLDGGTAEQDVQFERSEFVYSWRVDVKGSTGEGYAFDNETGEKLTLTYDNFYKKSGSLFRGTGKEYYFNCRVKEKIYYSYFDGTARVEASTPAFDAGVYKDGDSKSSLLKIVKGKIYTSDLIWASKFGIGGANDFVDVNGNTYVAPRLKEAREYGTEGYPAGRPFNGVSGTFTYNFISLDTGKADVYGDGSGKYDFTDVSETVHYSVIIGLLDDDNYEIGGTGDVGCTLVMNCEDRYTIDGDIKGKLQVTSEPAEPYNRGTEYWVKSLSIAPPSGFAMKTDLTSSYSAETFRAEEGVSGVCPTKLMFSKGELKIKGEMNQTDIGVEYTHDYPVMVDKTAPSIDDSDKFKIVPGTTVKEIPGKGYYIKGNFNVSGSFNDKQGDEGSKVDGSGVYKAYYKLNINGGASGEYTEMPLTGGALKSFNQQIDIDNIDAPRGGSIEVYAEDNVGNKSFAEKIEFIMKDTQGPTFTFTDTGATIPSGTTGTSAGTAAEIYIGEGRAVYLQIEDDASGVDVVTPGDGGAPASTDKWTDNKQIYSYSYATGVPTSPIEISATDFAGNTSKIYVKFIEPSDAKYKIDKDKIEIDPADYGYDNSDPSLNVPCSIYEGNLPNGYTVDVKNVTVESGSGDKTEKDAFQVSEVSTDGKYTVKPTGGLNVKPGLTPDVGAMYKAVIHINYTLYKDGDVRTLVDQHVVTREVNFTVNPVALGLAYKGGTEYYHTREYERDTANWFAANVEVSGFKNGQTVDVLGGWNPNILHDGATGATSSDLMLSGGDSVMTSDGYIIGDGSLTFTLGQNIRAASASSTNYNYYYKAGTYTNSNKVTCVRRPIKEGYSIKPASDYNDEDDETGHVPGNTEWYVEDMIIESDTSAYKIYDATVPGPTGNVDINGEGEDPYKLDPTDTESGLDTLFIDYSEKFEDDGTPAAVKKYYYIMNTVTREISSQMIEIIRIDTTDPGMEGGTQSPLTRSDKPMVDADATGDIDDSAHLPYFYVEKNLWREFLYTITGKMFFNDIMDVKVKCNFDDQSGIAETAISIVPTEYKSVAEIKKASIEWDTVYDGDVSISEEKQKSGFIYLRITNGAGLTFYRRSEPWIVFDTKGPEVKADYEGEENVGQYNHDVVDGDEFIADEVHFEVHDDQSLYFATGGAVEVPAIKIYKGTDIGSETNVISDPDQFTLHEETNTLTFSLPSSDEPYTVVSKDNSGLISTRYFKVSKPVYGLKVDTLEFNTGTYGTPVKQSLKLKWKKTGNATPTITNVKIDPEGDFTVTPGNAKNEYEISPAEKLDAGLHVGKVTVTYNDGKTATGECRLTVRKKLLVASFEGGTIYKGQKLTQKDGVISGFIEGSKTISVSGFVGDDTVATAAGYEAPTITIPEYPSETMIVTPKGGSAKNYIFENSSNVGGVITVLTDKAAKNTHYTVEGTLSSTGWYISNIKIKPKTGYQLTKDAAGSGATNEINIYNDTNAGEEKFYIKDSATTGEKAGEVYEQSVFSYRKDVVNPQITGVADGMTYQENKKTVTVKDDYLYRVAVNGVRQSVTNNKSEFDVVATETQGTFFITAEDYAGHITTATISLLQPDGSAPEGSEATTSSLHPEDDIIQDDTEDGTDTDLGTLTRKVQLVDGAPSTTFTSTISELKTGVLDASERAVMREGSDANVKLRVQNIDGSVSQADKELVIAALGDYTVAQYLDITLWKTVGNGEEKQVSSTNNPISVTISIPNSFRSPKSGKVRQFAIVRVHNGSSTVLQDKDSSANTITISTSKFSVYALAYRDTDKGSTGSGSGNTAGSGRGNSGGGNSSGGGSSGGGSTGGGSTGGSGGGGYSGGSSGGSSGGGSAETGGVATPAPRTGDSSPIVPVTIGFGVAFVGLVAFIIIRRRMNYEWVYLGDDGKYYDKDGNLYEGDD